MLCAAAALTGVADRVSDDLEARRKSVDAPRYFELFKKDMPAEKREALAALYAYMPLPDITDYPASFFEENVDYTLRAKHEMPWGDKVPEREFRHFVLPVRVNNENLDNYRSVIYEELKDRVKDLSMIDAILEINHWCHEKVTYQPSDMRTHSPLASINSAIGRCGEESTFTVSALRAMGIPARQVYTPRWAHTDDNHAWVEAWADGKWYFLGACEPEAVLNLAWFNAPASRGMLMHNRAIGRYDGPEEHLLDTPEYTDINVTANYAPVDTLRVKVVNAEGKPVKGAKVSFRLYNYAEYYPVATKTTSCCGKAQLTAGLGDMLVWATDGDAYGFAKGHVGDKETLLVTLDHKTGTTDSREVTIVPPAPRPNVPEVSPEAAALNDRRKAYEDSVRTAYTASFLNAETAATRAREMGLDTERATEILVATRGNHNVVCGWLMSVPAHDRDRALKLLESLSTKDLSDVTRQILDDHFTTQYPDTELYADYVASPRIYNEFLTPWRSYFTKAIPEAEQATYRATPQEWVAWVASNIKTDRSWQPNTVRMHPESVWEYRHTDPVSRDIFFVASARAMGIPARIDWVTGKPQWADPAGQWNDAVFTTETEAAAAPKGRLTLTYEQAGRIDNPRYYVHFSLSKLENGEPQLLNYDDDATWSSTFKNGAELDAGDYMLVSGQRLADGAVLSLVDIFTVEPGKDTVRPLNIRQDDSEVQVIGGFNAETLYHDAATGTDKSIISTTGRGYYVLGLLTPNHEPTNHALRDIAAQSDDFEQWGGKMMLIFKDADELARFDASQLPDLPGTAVIGTDINGQIADALTADLKLAQTDRPVFVIADTFNRVVFVVQGYTIGLGDRLIDTIHRLKE